MTTAIEWLVRILQVIIALGLLNVWLIRAGRPTAFRGGDAKNMREEFAEYGLPAWFMVVIGTLKVTLSVLLLIGLWVPVLTRPAAGGIAVLMAGAIAMHFKVRDPLKKALPAITVFTLAVLVAILG